MELTDDEKQNIMNQKMDFALFGMIDLEKSASKENEGKRIVFGEISNPEKDEQGENLIQKSLDFSYFDDRGVIKYEHFPKNSPSNIIGFPHERYTTEKSTVVKGALLKNHKMADETWSLICAIEQHNRDYPDHQKTLGWSVEGNYGKKRRVNGRFIKGAKIYNVVITPNPVLKSTYLKMVENHNAPIMKSLCATPAETDVTKKTGGDVIVEDNIDKKVKETVIGGEINNKKKKKKKKTKEEYVMKSFENYDEAVEHFVNQGLEEEEAEKMAKSLGLELEGDKDADGSTEELKGIKKSLNDIKNWIKDLSKSEGEDEDESLEMEDLDKGLESEDTEVDITEFLKGIDEKNDEILSAISEKNETLEKAIDSFCDVIESLSERVDSMEKSMSVEGHPVGEAIQVLMKSRTGMSVADLQKFNIVAAAPEGNAEIGNFGQLHARLEKSVDVGKITLQEMSRAESAFRINDSKTLDEVIKKCEDK
ncbi:MAG TPA: hypothetical protein DHW42_11805 [Candidatus Marinimicrobia bacterium]|nr:hypothetical protein [Candidatus Neomarinimicrobiota bacterium]